MSSNVTSLSQTVPTIEDYLKITRNKLFLLDYENLHIVLGNESCDLDSAVSSLVYATFLKWQYEQFKCRVCTRLRRPDEVYKDDIFVPILNVNREDYPIKTEVAYCFQQHGICKDNLVFRNEINIEELTEKSRPRVYLVDHHVLSKSDQHLAPYVVEIIDHRPTDRSSWPYHDDTRLTMELVGSCSTLVAQRLRDLSALMSKDAEFFNAYPVCADLLHSTIILDTVNFSKELKKATPHDEDVVMFLETLLKPTDYENERKVKLDGLVNARKDVSTLSPAQLLKKDVKILADVLVPSFPLLVKEFLSRPGALEAVSEALGLHKCTTALLLGMDLTHGLKRDTGVYCPNDISRCNKLSEFLQSWKPSLELIKDLPDSKEGVLYFTQNNLTASRKQYMPALMEFLNQYK